ncbi:DUF3800 domain-containing protein [Legionella longbeachae]|nr:DUF3800 domain-containing protein [Legionella longbeachae]RZV26668.1 DUF3800 domain-containing protein [Legionella longbeachae]VEE04149.1 Protein of uncharacterised function (DUF3800) [Legionella oakridgensis]
MRFLRACRDSILYYGLLSSPVSLEVNAHNYLSNFINETNISFIHTKKLSLKTISNLVPSLLKMKNELNLDFKLYRLHKSDLVLIMFFDKIFDCGVNPRVSYTAYWTYLRYIFVLELFDLFDQNDLKKSWSAHLNRNTDESDLILIDVCKSLKSKAIKNNCIQKSIIKALNWVIKNPRTINYNATNDWLIKQWSPNIINFQAVLHGIQDATVTSNVKPEKIIIDQQLEFNNSQFDLQDVYKQLKQNGAIRDTKFLPKHDYTNMPDIPLEFISSKDSIGLQIVDIYLWTHRRFLEGMKENDPEQLYSLINKEQPINNDLSKQSIITHLCYFLRELTPCAKKDKPILMSGIEKLKSLGILTV